MRHNLPVVNHAFDFPPEQTLVSMTDLKGRITYCNAAFVAVSGFAMEELLGQPHNLIRHPDMPAEAFRDLWETIAKGTPWSAAVKNRRKDGSYYWVMANVTPVLQGGRPVGYMSVRTHAAADDIRRAEALYAGLRSAAERGTTTHRLRGGHVQRTGWRGALARCAHPGLGTHLVLTTALLGAVAFGAGRLASGESSTALLGGAGAAALAAAAAVWRLRSLAVQPLERILHFCNRMAAGDLAGRMAERAGGLRGEVAGALNQLNVNLLSVVGDARTEAVNLRRATAEIAAGNTELSTRTEAQAASLEQTAASMEQITSTVRQSAASASQAAGLAQHASAATQSGNDAAAALSDTVQQIRTASLRIGEIIGVIEGIAFQTSILSLNAAVEAARAGEQGKGFAVVASEVRALAQRTANASKEVRALIENAGRAVDAGSEQAGVTRATMDKAMASVVQLSALMQSISHGAQEQLAGISQVNRAVGELDGITQQNAALVEQVTSSALDLQRRADALAASVNVFQLGRGRDAASAQVDAVALRRAAKAA